MKTIKINMLKYRQGCVGINFVQFQKIKGTQEVYITPKEKVKYTCTKKPIWKKLKTHAKHKVFIKKKAIPKVRFETSTIMAYTVQNYMLRQPMYSVLDNEFNGLYCLEIDLNKKRKKIQKKWWEIFNYRDWIMPKLCNGSKVQKAQVRHNWTLFEKQPKKRGAHAANVTRTIFSKKFGSFMVVKKKKVKDIFLWVHNKCRIRNFWGDAYKLSSGEYNIVRKPNMHHFFKVINCLYLLDNGLKELQTFTKLSSIIVKKYKICILYIVILLKLIKFYVKKVKRVKYKWIKTFFKTRLSFCYYGTVSKKIKKLIKSYKYVSFNSNKEKEDTIVKGNKHSEMKSKTLPEWYALYAELVQEQHVQPIRHNKNQDIKNIENILYFYYLYNRLSYCKSSVILCRILLQYLLKLVYTQPKSNNFSIVRNKNWFLALPARYRNYKVCRKQPRVFNSWRTKHTQIFAHARTDKKISKIFFKQNIQPFKSKLQLKYTYKNLKSYKNKIKFKSLLLTVKKAHVYRKRINSSLREAVRQYIKYEGKLVKFRERKLKIAKYYYISWFSTGRMVFNRYYKKSYYTKMVKLGKRTKDKLMPLKLIQWREHTDSRWKRIFLPWGGFKKSLRPGLTPVRTFAVLLWNKWRIANRLKYRKRTVLKIKIKKKRYFIKKKFVFTRYTSSIVSYLWNKFCMECKNNECMTSLTYFVKSRKYVSGGGVHVMLGLFFYKQRKLSKKFKKVNKVKYKRVKGKFYLLLRKIFEKQKI